MEGRNYSSLKRTEGGSPSHSAPISESGFVDSEEPLDLFGQAARTRQNILEEAATHCFVHCCPFRELCYKKVEGLREVCSRLHHFYGQWLREEDRMKAQRLDLVALQQSLGILPPEMEGWVCKCRAETSSQAMTLTEDLSQSDVEQTLQRKQQVHKPFMEVTTQPPKAPENVSHLLQDPVLEGISQEDPSQKIQSAKRRFLSMYWSPWEHLISEHFLFINFFYTNTVCRLPFGHGFSPALLKHV
ncbi:zinc finger and SCAN domain-containing protein 9-like [Pantherophis guttatus]|uniref:Zinc finger and SCAN domain-containing protein 9-like n=1 Tax=Pantherophis guttatus TaxID=94885 RepID=A0A6P9C587_PANGU|nr:zinc finger and SCAN domain-containing protein 9-like [Pantherophis guttatus]